MTNTINNVPRELLERVKSLCEYWFVSGQQRHMSATEYKTWHALGFGSSAFTELRALLSAPSPAGADGLKRYEVFPYLDDDVAELDICESDDGTFVKYDDVTAIIDGLRGEVERSKQFAAGHVLTNGRISASLHAVEAERDQQAQRIGELEGLLREVHDTYRSAIHWEDLRGTMKRIDAAIN